jgi:hypothetical protein
MECSYRADRKRSTDREMDSVRDRDYANVLYNNYFLKCTEARDAADTVSF